MDKPGLSRLALPLSTLVLHQCYDVTSNGPGTTEFSRHSVKDLQSCFSIFKSLVICLCGKGRHKYGQTCNIKGPSFQKGQEPPPPSSFSPKVVSELQPQG